MATKTKEETIIEKAIEILPKLSKKKPALIRKLYAVLEEHFPSRKEMNQILNEIRELRRTSDKRFEEQGKRIEEQGKRIEEQGKRIEENGKRIEEQGKAILSLAESVRKLEISIQALGARWGIFAEHTFKNAISGLLLKKLDVKEVKKWRVYDKEGTVFGRPCWVEADIILKNNVHYLIEIKSSASTWDVGAFYRIGKLYKKKEGVKPKLILVSVFLRKETEEMAKKFRIEVFTSQEYLELSRH